MSPSAPYRSASSLLTFCINRGGSNISGAQKRKLGFAMNELRALFGRGSSRA
jgi:hypothetical protein